MNGSVYMFSRSQYRERDRGCRLQPNIYERGRVPKIAMRQIHSFTSVLSRYNVFDWLDPVPLADWLGPKLDRKVSRPIDVERPARLPRFIAGTLQII